MRTLRRFLCDDDAATAVEYAVMLALIIAVCITAISATGGEVLSGWSNNQQQLDNAIQNAQGS